MTWWPKGVTRLGMASGAGWEATADLVDQASEWQDIADDPRFPTAMRHHAQGCADAIYAELGMKVKP